MKSVQSLFVLLCRLVGLFPVTTDFRFSKAIFVRSVICGVFSLAYAVVYLTKVSTDKIRRSSATILNIMLMSAWAAFWKRAPRGFHNISTALLELERFCPARLQFPWSIHSLTFLILFKLILIIATAGTVIPIVVSGQIFARTIKQSITSLFPLQFAIFTDLVRQVFLELEKMLPCLRLDDEDLILLRQRELCGLFQRLAEFYMPHLKFSFISLAVSCPTYVYTAIYDFKPASAAFIFVEIYCNFFTVFFIAHAFARLQAQVASFNKKVRDAVHLKPELESNHRISLFMEYNPTLNIKGYSFPLDYSLVIELFGIMATWTLIFLQFREVKPQGEESVANVTIWNQTRTTGLP